jgi:hypothetical protein
MTDDVFWALSLIITMYAIILFNGIAWFKMYRLLKKLIEK